MILENAGGNRNADAVLVSLQSGFLPSYSMLYLDAFLSKSGISTQIFYPLIHDGTGEELIKKIVSLKPRIVGIGGLYDDRFLAKKIIDELSPYRKEFTVVVGGNMVSPIPEFMVKKLTADIAVVGEGEIVFTKLVDHILKGKDYSGIGGLVIRDGESVWSTDEGEYVKDLNTMPPLNYNKIPMEYFIDVFKFYKTNTRTSIVYTPSTRLGAIPSGRSCFFTCNFCYHHSPMRQVNLATIINQAKEFKERFNINLLRFVDDLTFIGKKQTLDFCYAWIKENINLKYMVSMHFTGIDEEVVLALKESGCMQVGLGLESGSQRVLDKMNKKIKLEQILSGLELFKKHNILWNGAVQVGQHDETEEDVQKTIGFYYPYINERSTISTCITTPYPGTPLYKLGLASGLIKSHEEAYYRLQSPTALSYNFSKMASWRIYYLRYKIAIMFDVAKQMRSHGIVKGSWYFIRAIFLKAFNRLANVFG